MHLGARRQRIRSLACQAQPAREKISVMTKAELRRDMRQRLRKLGDDRAVKSRAVCAAISMHPAFVSARRVALYSPLPSEPDLNALWEHGARAFCYPRVAGERIEFVEVAKLDDLVAAAWNPWVREPALSASQIVKPSDIGLILVPGLAFTRQGARLGRGGGYYDRFLAQLPRETTKLGICFDVQLAESLPAEPHDESVDGVITESGLAT
jgi:5-formyltetrahydrofolate cyclo-ligase